MVFQGISLDGTEFYGPATYDYRYYRYAGICGDSQESLVLFLSEESSDAGGTRRGLTLETPGSRPGTYSGVRARILGATGATGSSGPIEIRSVGDGVSLLYSVEGNTAEFKVIAGGDDIQLQMLPNGTLMVGGVKANSADSIDMGVTGELVFMELGTSSYAAGASGTYWNVSAWPRGAAGSSAYHETLSAKLIDHREMIQRYGNQATGEAFPVGHSQQERVDVQLHMTGGNVQKVYCGTTTGYIKLPYDNYTNYPGQTYSLSQNFTLILHNAASHGLVTDHWGSGTPLQPYQIFNTAQNKDDDYISVMFPDPDSVEFSKGIDIFNFVYTEQAVSEKTPGGTHKWLALNAGINYGITFEGLPEEMGSCCYEEAEENGCDDYVTRKYCAEVDGIFNLNTLCIDTLCSDLNDGACCTMNSCILSNQTNCEQYGGYFFSGLDCTQVDCNDYPCDDPTPLTGACCVTSYAEGEVCYDCLQVDHIKCSEYEGEFKGYNTLCSNDPCPEPSCPKSACCHGDPVECQEVSENTCSVLGGVWYVPEDGEPVSCCSLIPEFWYGCGCKDSNRYCRWGPTQEDVIAQLEQEGIDEGSCRNVGKWNCEPPTGGGPPDVPGLDCQLPCYNAIAPNDFPSNACMDAICKGCNDCGEACLFTPTLGCCCINGEAHPFYPQYDCTQLGGTWTDTSENTCIDETGEPITCEGGGGSAGDCVECEEVGACCRFGLCSEETLDSCTSTGGEYQGNGTTCSDPAIDCCDNIGGACCIGPTCVEVTNAAACSAVGGVYQGVGTDCDPSPCDDGGKDPGACCCTECDCIENMEPGECIAREAKGCGTCIHHSGLSCCDAGCIDDQDSCSTCPKWKLAQVGWHMYIDLSDCGSGYEWANDDSQFKNPRIGLTRPSDGYFNTHGWPSQECINGECGDLNGPYNVASLRSSSCDSELNAEYGGLIGGIFSTLGGNFNHPTSSKEDIRTELYVMSKDEFGFLKKQMCDHPLISDNLSSILSGVYWTSSRPLGSSYNSAEGFAWNSSTGKLINSTRNNIYNIRLALRYMKNSNKGEDTGPNGESPGAVVPWGDKGRAMVYVGYFTPGCTRIFGYDNSIGEQGDPDSNACSEILPPGPCCECNTCKTGFNQYHCTNIISGCEIPYCEVCNEHNSYHWVGDDLLYSTSDVCPVTCSTVLDESGIDCSSYNSDCLPKGTCCYFDDTPCAVIPMCECDGVGTWYSDDSGDCINVCGKVPTWPCCIDGTCWGTDGTGGENLTKAECVGKNGEPQYGQSSCNKVTCKEKGRCCYGCGYLDCDYITYKECAAAGGDTDGWDSSLDCQTPCVEVTGACCNNDDNTCEEMNQCDCQKLINTGGNYYYWGDGTNCGSVTCDCDLCGACCCLTDNIVCQGEMLPAECASAGGVFHGKGTICADVDCCKTYPKNCAKVTKCEGKPTIGVCCYNNNIPPLPCSNDGDQDACGKAGGVWLGDGGDCSQYPTTCPVIGGCCRLKKDGPLKSVCSYMTEAECIAGDKNYWPGIYSGDYVECDCPDPVVGKCCSNRQCYDLPDPWCSLIGVFCGNVENCDECQGSACVTSKPPNIVLPDDTNCCDDNYDGINDYWCLDCKTYDSDGNILVDECPGVGTVADGGAGTEQSYIGCISDVQDSFSWMSAGWSKDYANLNVLDPTDIGIRNTKDNDWVEQFAMADWGENSGCPCTPGYSLEDCRSGANTPTDGRPPLECDPACCHWHGNEGSGEVGESGEWWNRSKHDFYGKDEGWNNSPLINYPLSEIPQRNVFGGIPSRQALDEKNPYVGAPWGGPYMTGCPAWRATNADGELIKFLGVDGLYGGWEDDEGNVLGGDSCSYGSQPSEVWQKYISGVGVNSPSYYCPPYEGLISGDWWINGQKVWEIPIQNKAIDPLAISPCYARRFKASFETYIIDDRFQIIQLPWPKGARDDVEAWKRIRCYLNCLSGGFCFNPEENQNAQLAPKMANMPSYIDPEDHTWLNGIKVIHGCGPDSTPGWKECRGWDDKYTVNYAVTPYPMQQDCAEKFLGYPAEKHWILFDSFSIGTSDCTLEGMPYGYTDGELSTDESIRVDANGDWERVDENSSKPNYTQGHPHWSNPNASPDCIDESLNGWFTFTKCIAYNYPSCPARLDEKQVQLHWDIDTIREDPAEKLTKEQYEIQERMKEGYGPAGQGSIPPIAVGFANTAPDEDGWGGSSWQCRINECSGRQQMFVGSNNLSGMGGGGGGATCPDQRSCVDTGGQCSVTACDAPSVLSCASPDSPMGVCCCPYCDDGEDICLNMTYEECKCRSGWGCCCPAECGFLDNCGECPCCNDGCDGEDGDIDISCCYEKYDDPDNFPDHPLELLACLNCVDCKHPYSPCGGNYPPNGDGNSRCNWTPNYNSMDGVFSPCTCDCDDFFYPSETDEDLELDEWINDGPCHEVASCCVSIGKSGWPGDVNVQPWKEPKVATGCLDRNPMDGFWNWNDGSDLVGWLCGWNSPAHELAISIWGNVENGEWDGTVKYCLDEHTCPALFVDDPDSLNWSGCVGNGCWDEDPENWFATSSTGMGLVLPLNAAGCELGKRGDLVADEWEADPWHPGTDEYICLNGHTVFFDTANIGLRGCPMKDKDCHFDYHTDPGTILQGIYAWQPACCPNPSLAHVAANEPDGPNTDWATALGPSNPEAEGYDSSSRPSWLYDFGQTPSQGDARQWVSQDEILYTKCGEIYLGPGGRMQQGMCHLGHAYHPCGVPAEDCGFETSEKDTCPLDDWGACCIDNNCTIVENEDACDGDYQGDGTNCDGGPCDPPPTTGACCLDDPLTCIDDLDSNQCDAFGGTYQGDGTVCTKDCCPNCNGGRKGYPCCWLKSSITGEVQCDDGMTEEECHSIINCDYYSSTGHCWAAYHDTDSPTNPDGTATCDTLPVCTDGDTENGGCCAYGYCCPTDPGRGCHCLITTVDNTTCIGGTMFPIAPIHCSNCTSLNFDNWKETWNIACGKECKSGSWGRCCLSDGTCVVVDSEEECLDDLGGQPTEDPLSCCVENVCTKEEEGACCCNYGTECRMTDTEQDCADLCVEADEGVHLWRKGETCCEGTSVADCVSCSYCCCNCEGGQFPNCPDEDCECVNLPYGTDPYGSGYDCEECECCPNAFGCMASGCHEKCDLLNPSLPSFGGIWCSEVLNCVGYECKTCSSIMGDPDCSDNTANGSCCFVDKEHDSATCVDSVNCEWCRYVNGCWNESKCEDRIINEEMPCCNVCEKRSRCATIGEGSGKQIAKDMIELKKKRKGKVQFRPRYVGGGTQRSTAPGGEGGIKPPLWLEPPPGGISCFSKFACGPDSAGNPIEHPDFPDPIPFSPSDKSCTSLKRSAMAVCRSLGSAKVSGTSYLYLKHSPECCGGGDWNDSSGCECSDTDCQGGEPAPTGADDSGCDCFCCECKDLSNGCWVWNPVTLSYEWIGDPLDPACTEEDVPGEIARKEILSVPR